jgi:hypothetical protein
MTIDLAAKHPLFASNAPKTPIKPSLFASNLKPEIA